MRLHRAILFSTVLAAGLAGAVAVDAQTTTTPAPKPAAQPAAKPTDSDLSGRIAHRLETSELLHKYDVKASVSAGVATVTGTVATAAQKTEAARLAHVTGVTRVDNQVTVDANVDKSLAEKAKAGMSKTGEAITDAWITAKVHYHFLGEDALKGSDINVDTANHIVTLKGTVRTTAAKTRAEALARQTEGVSKVVDQLTISTKSSK